MCAERIEGEVATTSLRRASRLARQALKPKEVEHRSRCRLGSNVARRIWRPGIRSHLHEALIDSTRRALDGGCDARRLGSSACCWRVLSLGVAKRDTNPRARARQLP